MSATNGKGNGEVAKMPGKNGHGWLKRGGSPGGARPGSGRPPSAIRERLRGSFDKRVAILEQIADDPHLRERDRIAAIEMLAKYGLGTTTTETDTEGRDVPRGRLTPDEIAEHVARIVARR